jgi:hypothetical protein
MNHIGDIVWLVIVLIGVISTLRKNAAKNRPKVPAPQRTIAPTAFAQTPVQTPPPIIVPAALVVPPRAPAPPPPAAQPEAPSVFPMSTVRPVGTGLVRGMFEGPATLVRAIVAAEVLGPPKSMQEQSIWSPRHSEPSI